MRRNMKLRNAVKLAIAVNTGLVGLTMAPGAFAQDAAQATIDEVVVTGSRIKKKDFTSNAPVATVGGEQIELTGTINTESLLNTLPQTVPGFDRTSNNPGNGTATVDLRGLGSNRTLVLIDGVRVVPTTENGSVDINSIPTSLIERIEVLTGGASAVYGSDAVAGVVNFILKRDFEGVEFNVGYETTQEGDADFRTMDITLGANLADGRGNVTLNMSVTDREDLFQGDRDFAFFAQFDDTDADGNPILIDGGSSGIPGTSIFSGALEALSPDSFGATFDANPTGGATIRPFETTGDNDFYNYAPVNYIQLPQKRYQMTSLGHFDISDNATAYGSAMFTASKVPQQLAPTPIFQTTTFTLDGSPFLDAFTQGIMSGDNTSAIGFGTRADRIFSDGGSGFTFIDPDDPTSMLNTCTNCLFDNSFVDENDDGIDDDPRLDTSALIDTDGDGIADTGSAFIRRRLLEVGPRVSDDSFSTFQLKVGMRGNLIGNWDYDGYLQKGNVSISSGQQGNVNRDRFDQAMLLDLSDPTGATCADPSTSGSTTGCAPINIWGEGNISEEGAAFLRTAVAATADYEQFIGALNVSGDLGDFLALPGGSIGVAIGYEHIEDDFAFRPSQDLASGDIAGFNGSPPVSGGYDVDSFYAELYLPILSGVPFFETLDLELAFRTSDYSTVGSVESWKVGGSWAPVAAVRFRGGINRAVRAPSIGELFAPQGEGFPSATDPCSAEGAPDAATRAICVATGVPAGVVGTPAINLAAGQVRAITGGNPDLTEETADTLTFGVVVSPIDNLTLSIDYFDIDIEDYIDEFGGGAANVLAICYDAADPAGGVGSDFCNIVNRRGDGTIDFVLLSSANVANQTLKGVDLIASYDMELFGGDLRIQYIGTYTTESKFTAFEGAEVIDCAGKFGQLLCGNPLPDYGHRMTFNWGMDNFTTQLAWQFIGSVDDDDPDELYFVETIDSVSYFDLSGVYRFTDNYSLTLGINNLFDKSPPILGDNQQQANTYPATYDVFGRTFFINARVQF